MDSSKWVPPVYNEYGITQWGWRVSHRENLKMSDNVWIGSFSVIDAAYGVEIGEDVIIGYGCVITSLSRIENKQGQVTLKKGCKIGAQAIVVPGVTIGENAIVGCNSYVNKDVPAGEVWYGTPAKFAGKVADLGKDRMSIYENPTIPLQYVIDNAVGWVRENGHVHCFTFESRPSLVELNGGLKSA